MFHMVVHWHKLGEVENECTLHNFVVLAINILKIIKVSKNLPKLWQNNFDCFFFWDTVYMLISNLSTMNIVMFQVQQSMAPSMMSYYIQRDIHYYAWNSIIVTFVNFHQLLTILTQHNYIATNNTVVLDFITVEYHKKTKT